MNLRSKAALYAATLALTVLALALIVCPALAAAAQPPGNYGAPPDIWKGYDPDKLPLDIQVIKSWTEGGCWYEKFWFTGEIYDGFKTRILAMRGGPIGKTEVPGILHIHGGGQTYMPLWVKYWAKRGYVCLSYDYCGPAYDRTEYSDWGPLINCNMIKPWNGFWPKPGVKNTSWYHWIELARRGLTVLARTKGVNPNKLGVFGISVGAQLAWMVAGVDSRVKAAVPFYGCGYLYDERRQKWGALPPSADEWEFNKLLSAEASAPYIKGAVLFLSGTNDMFGWMPTAYEIMKGVPGEWRLAFSPKYDHHAEPEQAIDLPLFMDWQLRSGKPFPKTPRLQVKLGADGVPEASVSPDQPGGVTRVEVYYALGDKIPGARFWHPAAVKRSGNVWRAAAPVMDTWDEFVAFANVFYKSGVCLTSNMIDTIPGQLGKARATLKWTPDLWDPGNPLSKWYYVPAYVDPNVDYTYLINSKDSFGPYFYVNPEGFTKDYQLYIGSEFPGDPEYCGHPGDALAFDFKGGFSADFQVVAVYHDRLPDFKRFTATVAAKDSNGSWRHAVLPVAAFKAEDGKVLDTWKGIDKFEIIGDTTKAQPPGFKDFRWVDTSVSGAEPAVAEGPKRLFTSPPDIWRGYDPEKLPLDIQILKSWQQDGCWYQKLRFTGEIADGVKTRILAIRGGPIKGSHLPGLLHIHGGGQTLSLPWVEFWAKRGYVCISIDFCGKAYDRTEYTEWGPLEQCNMPKAGDGVFVKPDLRASSWYHWVLACRRALTVLGDTRGVDKNRMGIFGVSVGGTLCWMVAGCDHRVKAAAPVYGCGYNIDPRRPADEATPPDADHMYFKRILAPEAWAPYMSCPVMFLDATNDMHGRMPTAYDILRAVPGAPAAVRQVFTPRYDHHIEPAQSVDLPLWMDWQLKSGPAFPKSPEVKLSIGKDGVPLALVLPDKAGSVRKVDVYYSLDDKVPGARFWRTAPAVRGRGGWRASTPVMNVWKSISVFANVFYTSGACLSSNLIHIFPGELGKARATLSWTPDLDAGDILRQWYYVPAYVDPNVDWSYLKEGTDPSRGRYLTLNPEAFGDKIDFYIGTHAVGDEQYQGQPGKALAFDFRGGFSTDLTVMAVWNDRLIGSKTFTATVSTDAAKAGWQHAVLALSNFKGEDGKALESWKGIDKVNITGTTSKTEPPCFTGFRWVDDSAKTAK